MIPIARNFRTRPPTGTPRRAISPSEGLRIHHISIRERPRLPSTARIGRAHSYRARSASKKGTWPFPPTLATFSCNQSVSCVPSQYGGVLVCLHMHKATSFVSSTVNSTGSNPVP